MSAAAALSGVSGAEPGKVSNQFAKMGSDEFIKIMITELTQQDPLKPSDTSAILEQMSSLRNIESQLSLQERLESLVLQNGVSSASGMIGKMIEGLDESNDRVTGLVTSVRIADNKTFLELDSGKTLAVERVTRIGLPIE
jgi:flagellar basal-body rod modification protein FlgD